MKKNAVIPKFKAMNIEKRRCLRLPFQLPTEYSRVDSFITRFGHTVNICEGGILVRLPEKLKLGENLRVKIYFDMDFDLYSIEASAKVVWLDGLEQKKKENWFGLEFIEMSNEDLEKFEKFIKSYF